jgi:two-component system, LytTR family, sensor kinase
MLLAMATDVDPDGSRPRWAVIAGVCLLVGTASALGAILDPRGTVSELEELGLHWGHWAAWAFFLPLCDAVVRRFPLDAGRRAWSIAAYIGLAPLFLSAHAALHLLIARQFARLPESAEAASIFLTAFAGFDLGYRVLGYSFALALSLGLEYHRRATEAARHAASLEAQLAQARFDVLKAQLNPHFLFNTLHSISALLHRDADAADRMLARLGEFLRLTLENGASVEVPLSEELRFTQCYLGIQEVRFSDRLTTQVAVAPDVQQALVPHLLLQPLVENAVRHGIQRLVGAGQIVIRAARVNGSVRLEVVDNGPGPAPRGETPGLGLANTAARLQALYGPGHRFEAGGDAGGGFRVTIEVPYRVAGPEAACAS